MKTNDPFNQKNKQPFEVPTGYFEALPTRVQEAIQEDESKMTLWNKIKPILYGRFTISTSIMAILVLVILQLSNSAHSTSTINADEAYAYLNELETDELNENIMLEYFDEIPTYTVELTQEEIESYLLNQEYIENELY
jgi:hypothetical protein